MKPHAATLVLTLLLGPAVVGLGGEGYQIRGRDCIVSNCQVMLVEEAQVATGETGRLTSIEASLGMRVEAGQELARLDDQQAQLELEQMKFQAAIAKEQAESSIKQELAAKTRQVRESELQRAREANLKVANAVPAVELVRLQLSVEQAALEEQQVRETQRLNQLAWQARQVDVALAEQRLGRQVIRAPIPGMVVKVLHTAGDWVEAGTPILRIVRLDRMYVQGHLNIDDFGPDVVNSLVTVEVVAPGGEVRQFPGKLVFASPEVEPVTGDFRVVAEVENREGRLSPGQAATMIVHLAEDVATRAARAAVIQREARRTEPAHTAAGQRRSLPFAPGRSP